MKYVSIDIETTGLDPEKNQIVEVGAVLDEIGSTTPIEELPKFRAVLIHEEMAMGAYCANLHKDLWTEILKVQKLNTPAIDKHWFIVGKLPGKESTYYCLPKHFETLFNEWLRTVCPSFIIDDDKLIVKINISGKNAGTFDIPFLEALPGWQGLVKFHRRVLDPASHCIQPDDEHIPDLQECLRRCGFEDTVKHTAVDDAIDIIRVIRQRRIGNSCFNDCSKCVYRDGCEVLSAECIGFESE